MSLFHFVLHTCLLCLVAGPYGVRSQGYVDSSDPYNIPYPGESFDQRLEQPVVMANPKNAAYALTAESQDVSPDIDSILDLQDMVVHEPVHGTILMPRMGTKARRYPRRQMRRSSRMEGSSGGGWGSSGSDGGNDGYASGYGSGYGTGYGDEGYGPFRITDQSWTGGETMEGNYMPAVRKPDHMFVMVDDPVVIVGPAGGAGTTGAAGGDAGTTAGGDAGGDAPTTAPP